MAEDQSEKVFPASTRKRNEARKKGQVAKSHELSGALVVLALLIAIRTATVHGIVFDSFRTDFQTAFAFNPHPMSMDMEVAHQWQLTIARGVAVLIVPAMLAAVALGLVTNFAQVGINITPQALKPDFNRVNPASGFKRMFSVHGLVELLKGLLKMTLIGWICWTTINGAIPLIANGMNLPFIPFISQIGELLWSLGLRVCLVLFILALADYTYQKYDFEKNLRMTREEMKQEMKQTDGDPLIKQKIRQRQRAIATKRMMQQVPKADVVITNPTHFAVAIKYDSKSMTAPKVVARGMDFVAQTIKEIAKEHKVPTVENVAVARALYHDVPLGKEIPQEMYQAVAEILAFVYRTKRR